MAEWSYKINGRRVTEEEWLSRKGVGFDPSCGVAPMTAMPWNPDSTFHTSGQRFATREEWNAHLARRGLIETSRSEQQSRPDPKPESPDVTFKKAWDWAWKERSPVRVDLGRGDAPSRAGAGPDPAG